MDIEYLILGANGLIGSSVRKKIEKKHTFCGTHYKRFDVPKLIRLDVTSDEELKEIFRKTNPRNVINCADLAGGYNFCESNPRIAKKFHLDANRTISKLCDQYNSRFVFISTDHVFDGTDLPYKEEDETNPLNLYGWLKLESEKFVRQHNTKYTIIRTTNVFGWDPDSITPNYMMGVYQSVNNKKSFKAPSYLWGTPTYVDDLALSIVELCEKDIDGLFHIVGSNYISRYDWAIKACEIARWDKSLIKEIKDVPRGIVPIPLKSYMNTDKFSINFSTKLHDVYDGLRMFVIAMKSGIW